MMGISAYIILAGMLFMGIAIAYSELTDGLLVSTNAMGLFAAGMGILMFWYAIIYPRTQKKEVEWWLQDD